MLSKFCQLHQLIFLSQIFPPIISYGWYQLQQSKFVAHPTVEFYQLCRHVRFCFVFRHWTKNYVDIVLLSSLFFRIMVFFKLFYIDVPFLWRHLQLQQAFHSFQAKVSSFVVQPYKKKRLKKSVKFFIVDILSVRIFLLFIYN